MVVGRPARRETRATTWGRPLTVQCGQAVVNGRGGGTQLAVDLERLHLEPDRHLQGAVEDDAGPHPVGTAAAGRVLRSLGQKSGPSPRPPESETGRGLCDIYG